MNRRRFNETSLFYMKFCYVVVVVSESLNLRVFGKVIVSDVFFIPEKAILERGHSCQFLTAIAHARTEKVFFSNYSTYKKLPKTSSWEEKIMRTNQGIS